MIGFVQGHISGAGAVHADHAQVVFSIGHDRSQAVYRGKSGNLQLIEQNAQFADCAGKFRSGAHQSNRLFGG